MGKVGGEEEKKEESVVPKENTESSGYVLMKRVGIFVFVCISHVTENGMPKGNNTKTKHYCDPPNLDLVVFILGSA